MDGAEDVIRGRQTRVFVPSSEPQEGWAETLIGRIFRPLRERFADRLEWFWFSRYGEFADDLDDCEAGNISSEYMLPRAEGGLSHRSMRFRYSVADGRLEEFEQSAKQLIDGHGYSISDFRPYDFVADTGSDRFLGVENRLPGRAEQRAWLVTQFYMASSRLVLDALAGPDADGRYRLETNDHLHQNPRGSTFQSIHHLFCNITGTPTDVYVFQKAGLEVIGFGTYISAPPAPPGGWDGSTAYAIWY